ncbi:MAG: hypothetical protein JJ979_02825 [Roseibium sp.]|nr:hypothetical protein [Roseibium sp.]
MSGPDLGSPSPEVGDICAALAAIKWEAQDSDHASDTLAKSLDRVLEMEKEHGCP